MLIASDARAARLGGRGHVPLLRAIFPAVYPTVLVGEAPVQ
jgi:hypothetical protein